MIEAAHAGGRFRGWAVKLKQRPEDFSVIESYRFEENPRGEYFVYRMDKQKLSTLAAVERLRERFKVRRQDVSFCGLKDKQGRTEQLIAVHKKQVELQDPDLRLTFVGRTTEPLSARNITSNRFSVIVRDLSLEEAERVPESVAEVERTGVVNYFDSQRFGFVKHGQGFIAKDLLRGDLQSALKSLIAKPSELDQSEDARVKKWFAENWGEWNKKPPYQSWMKYRPIIQRLQENPYDFSGALMAIDRRLRAMVVFEYQSYLWNDAVRRYLSGKVPARDLVLLRYQIGTLLFPRALPSDLARTFRSKTFPLLAKDSTFDDAEVKAANQATLERERLSLDRLEVTKVNAFHFKHEERPLFVYPGKLRASEPRPDEANRGRFKVVLSFTLPPGAYATLVVRRLLWFATAEHKEEAAKHKAPKRKPVIEQPEAAPPKATPPEVAPPKAASPKAKKGFLERQKERKTARAQARTEAAKRTRT
jgi:tRNA pseudouridine13 synthase